jgi:hypothetical protein
MKRAVMLSLVFAGVGCFLFADDPKSEPFRFGEDRGGKILAQLLPPSLPPSREHFSKQSTRGAAAIEQPAIPTAMISVNVPRLVIKQSSRDEKPGSIGESTPLTEYRSQPRLPQEPTFWIAEKVRVPSPDVNQAMPLPILGKPVPDRASLEDASLESSHVASLAGVMPVRTIAAPYMRFTIPNPFEHREAVQSKTALEEDPTPVTSTPKLPR